MKDNTNNIGQSQSQYNNNNKGNISDTSRSFTYNKKSAVIIILYFIENSISYVIWIIKNGKSIIICYT